MNWRFEVVWRTPTVIGEVRRKNRPTGFPARFWAQTPWKELRRELRREFRRPNLASRKSKKCGFPRNRAGLASVAHRFAHPAHRAAGRHLGFEIDVEKPRCGAAGGRRTAASFLHGLASMSVPEQRIGGWFVRLNRGSRPGCETSAVRGVPTVNRRAGYRSGFLAARTFHQPTSCVAYRSC